MAIQSTKEPGDLEPARRMWRVVVGLIAVTMMLNGCATPEREPMLDKTSHEEQPVASDRVQTSAPVGGTASPLISEVIAAPTHVSQAARHLQTPSPLQAEVLSPAPSLTETHGNTQRYIFPVQPADKVSYSSCHHDYPASDILTPVGSQFVAVTDGVVEFVSTQDTWNQAADDPASRGGLSVAIVGDDHVRYYGSHLSRIADGIAPGVRVVAGQLLALTGDSGNASGVAPHLHFGISHTTTPDDWAVRRGEINPYPYLEAWRVGKNVTPNLTSPGIGVC